MPIQQSILDPQAKSFAPAPAFVATNPQGNVRFTAGRLMKDAQTGERWGEYDDMPPVSWFEPMQGIGPAQEAAQSNLPVDPLEELQKRTQMRTQYIEQEIGAQESALQQAFDKQYGDLEGQYNIERHYIQNSPSIEPQQKARQIEQLNKRYELKIHDLRSQVQPGMQQLDAQRRQAMMQIEEDRQRREHEVSIIDRLAQQGVIEDPAAVLQQKLQAVGVNVPIGALRPTTPAERIRAQQAELRSVDAVLANFDPEVERGWYDPRKKVPVRYTPTGFEEDVRDATPEEAQMYRDLLQYQAQLRMGLGQELQGAFQLSNAAAAAENMKRAGRPMANQAHKITHPGGKSGASQTQEVTVRSPNGRVGTVPVSELAQAVVEGYTIGTGR